MIPFFKNTNCGIIGIDFEEIDAPSEVRIHSAKQNHNFEEVMQSCLHDWYNRYRFRRNRCSEQNEYTMGEKV